jgi:hypothetical protein
VLRIRDCLGDGLRAIPRALPAIAVATALAAAPLVLYALATLGRIPRDVDPIAARHAYDVWCVVAVIASALLGRALAALLASTVVRALDGEPGGGWAARMIASVPAVATAKVALVAIGAGALALVGFAVPVAAALWVAPAAAAVERLSPGRASTRSAQLTLGAKRIIAPWLLALLTVELAPWAIARATSLAGKTPSVAAIRLVLPIQLAVLIVIMLVTALVQIAAYRRLAQPV